MCFEKKVQPLFFRLSPQAIPPIFCPLSMYYSLFLQGPCPSPFGHEQKKTQMLEGAGQLIRDPLQMTHLGPISQPIWAQTSIKLDTEWGPTVQPIRDPFRPHLNMLYYGFQMNFSAVSMVAQHMCTFVGLKWVLNGFQVWPNFASCKGPVQATCPGPYAHKLESNQPLNGAQLGNLSETHLDPTCLI